ncbi:B12-binding domain-containing radical SAM protein [Desulfitobacterium sp. PCE1]|uniref:B12-binding domain-containing radical SAM protein n=1 Tax=Desulfitobacterium sp. PCE1 TaxID=146907 RepID=UPI00037F823F|nr:radical SAM protein [Desulfitobacterium sp. PCE1]
MKLLLITASAHEIRQIRKTRVINFQQVTMPYLAALTPSHWEIKHIDEGQEEIDFNQEADLVGITFHTPSANYVYEIAAEFRKRGIPVVMGGPHVSLLPDEAEKHADAIFIGEAEDTWIEFLADFENKRFKKRYEQKHPSSLTNLPMARKDLFHRRDHSGGIMFATRGCPNQCEFCALAVMYHCKFRKRPVQEVAREYGSFNGKVIIFWDDNLAADPPYAKELFRALVPYRKWWSSQTSIHAGWNDELLELAAKSGCKQLFLGLESVSQISLDNANKSFNKVEDYYKIIKKIHSYGISVQVGIIFGFDEDDKSIFGKTISFLEAAGVQNATFNMLTPYPGTPLFKRLEDEGRILTYDWSKYNGRRDVVFKPKNMTCEELLEGFNWVNSQFYSLKSIGKRLSKSTAGLWWTLPLNLSYYFSYKLYGPNE